MAETQQIITTDAANQEAEEDKNETAVENVEEGTTNPGEEENVEEAAKKAHEERLDKIDKLEKEISKECKAQYAHWKKTATAAMKNKGLRDFERCKHSEEFKREEMKFM